MFVIIEGPDAAGKSSMLDALKRAITKIPGALPINSFHKGRPLEESRRWALNEYVISIDDLATSGATIVADRWHWGEVTYAPLKRPHTNLDGYGLLGVAGWRWVELFLMSRGATTWVMTQPLDVLEVRLRRRGDDFVEVDELAAIVERYDFGVSVAPSVVERLQPGDSGLSALRGMANAVVDRAMQVQKKTAPLRRDFPEYIGSTRPIALLLGDRRNITSEYGEETRLPFMPVNGNSGDFLLSALPDSFWPRAGIVNANDVKDPVRLYELWDTLGRPPVIALGREAERVAKLTEFTNLVGTVAHPQYMRRFHFDEKMHYGRTIEQLARGHNAVGSAQWILQ
jgi:hypothetical protein